MNKCEICGQQDCPTLSTKPLRGEFSPAWTMAFDACAKMRGAMAEERIAEVLERCQHHVYNISENLMALVRVTGRR